MTDGPRESWLDEITRRQVLRGAMGAGAALATGGIFAACGGDDSATTTGSGGGATAKIRDGGSLRVGATGGGAKDSIDAHVPVADPDIQRVWNMYEPLAVRSRDFSKLEMLLAESIEPDGNDPRSWTVRLKQGLTFHNGKTVTADDVIFSLKRIIDLPGTGAASIGYIDTGGLKKMDDRTVRIPLELANAGFPDDLGQYFNGIVPEDYDPKKPVGTGPFKYQSFTPGQRSVMTKFADYWQTGKPHVDELTIIDFPEATARVNALMSGQVEAISNLPASQVASVQGNSNMKVLNAETGAFQPFTMRVDASPFDDVRVRQAFKLIPDREQMIQQVLSGFGRVANDLYAPYDPFYAKDLPQRKQDFEQAKSLLQQAGRANLTVELVTADVFAGVLAAAQVFAEQAKGAGVTVRIRKLDTGTFYGDNYLKYVFSQDYWATRMYLPQVAQCDLPNSPFNETHFGEGKFEGLIKQARGELDEAKRREIIHQAQEMQYNEGGYIIPYFSNLIDGYSAKVSGFLPSKAGFNLGNNWFKDVGFVQGT